MYRSGKTLFPYYYPTTAVFVDDSREFLRGISLQADYDLVYKLCDSPLKALELVKNRNSCRPVHERVLTRDYENQRVTSSLSMNVDMAEIVYSIFDIRRYGEVSVVVVDYDMPEMSGLEFCREVDRHGVKKILLSGVADHSQGIEAFNEGIIDAFIMKSDKAAFQKVNEAIGRLQQKYFRDTSQVLSRALDATFGSYLSDERFKVYFNKICDEHSIVEYYLMSYPEGFLLIDRSGKQRVLMVQSEDEIRHQIEFARHEKAPAALLERLMRRKEIAFFPNPQGYFDPNDRDWEQHLYPAEEVVGKNRYYVSLQELSPFEFLSNNSFMSYAEYLELSDIGGNI